MQQVPLYPALDWLERGGGIRARLGTSENNRHAEYYPSHEKGPLQLKAVGLSEDEKGESAVFTDLWFGLSALLRRTSVSDESRDMFRAIF